MLGGQLGAESQNTIGDNAGEMGANLTSIELGTGLRASLVSVGLFHSCAYLSNNTLKCWGENTFGQLGQEDTTLRGDSPGEMGNSLPTINLGIS